MKDLALGVLVGIMLGVVAASLALALADLPAARTTAAVHVHPYD
ncbi:hypothetical protein [Nonomuraea sp. NPDC050783]